MCACVHICLATSLPPFFLLSPSLFSPSFLFSSFLSSFIFIFSQFRFLQLGDEAKKNKRKYGTASRATRRHVENDEEEGEGEDEREDESNDDSSGGGNVI